MGAMSIVQPGQCVAEVEKAHILAAPGAGGVALRAGRRRPLDQPQHALAEAPGVRGVGNLYDFDRGDLGTTRKYLVFLHFVFWLEKC